VVVSGSPIRVAIIGGAARAVLLADLGISAWLMTRTHRPVPVAGLALPEETEQAITEGVQTIFEDPIITGDNETAGVITSDNTNDLVMRLERLANSAALAAGQDAYQQAAEAHGLEAWIRRPDPNPCPACLKMADGKARPMSVKMWRHPGCECVAEPTNIGDEFRGKLVSGHGIAGLETTYARAGLRFERSTFVGRNAA
jgi:hypothetical protein